MALKRFGFLGRRRTIIALAILAGALAYAQDSTSRAGSADSPQAPAAGGPQGEAGPYSVPKKKQEEPPPGRTAPPKNPPGMGEFSISKDVALVTVPVFVTTVTGQFVPGLKVENFRVYEDGTPQKIGNLSTSEAPITAVLLIEFADIPKQFLYGTMMAADSFTQRLKPEDWIAVVFYDMKTHILTDFTQDKHQVQAALNSLQTPGFAERNLFDALADTVGRLERVAGRKYIILIGSGLDTFSKLTYDEIRKRIKGTNDITIFAISSGFALRNPNDPNAEPNFKTRNMANVNTWQVDNELNSFAELTGGRHYSPRTQAELPEVFRDIGASIRNQYVLSYRPTNPQMDGTYRKLKIELVDAQSGGPFKIVDEKGKPVHYTVVSREGYTAKHQVE
jgi:VWFA-related protein